MNALRKVLMPLLLIPAGMLVYATIYPDWQWESTGFEYLFVLVGIPIVMINLIAWFYPDILKAYFPVKEDWGQMGNKPVTFAIVLSTLIALLCVSAGTVSAVARVSARPTGESSAVQPATATAFARSVQSFSSATDPGARAVISTPGPSLEARSSPDQTPQIPVSGGELTSTPTFSATQAKFASVPTEPAATTNPSGSCTPATPQYVEAVGQTVQDMDPENVVIAGWMVQSKAAANLWFVAANIQSDTGTMLPGVWALFVDSEGNIDIFAIDDAAMNFSSADWGEDSEPVLTMQSDGAQAAYDCAALAK